MITIEKHEREAWQNLQFVLKAKSKDNARPNLNVVYSTGKHLMATDGYRLHIGRFINPKIPFGTYDVMETKNSILLIPSKIKFVNWKSAWTCSRRIVKKKVEFCYSKLLGRAHIYHAIYRTLTDKLTINPDYIEPFLNGNTFTVYIPQTDEPYPLVFRSEAPKGLVMPMTL